MPAMEELAAKDRTLYERVMSTVDNTYKTVLTQEERQARAASMIENAQRRKTKAFYDNPETPNSRPSPGKFRNIVLGVLALLLGAGLLYAFGSLVKPKAVTADTTPGDTPVIASEPVPTDASALVSADVYEPPFSVGSNFGIPTVTGPDDPYAAINPNQNASASQPQNQTTFYDGSPPTGQLDAAPYVAPPFAAQSSSTLQPQTSVRLGSAASLSALAPQRPEVAPPSTLNVARSGGAADGATPALNVQSAAGNSPDSAPMQVAFAALRAPGDAAAPTPWTPAPTAEDLDSVQAATPSGAAPLGVVTPGTTGSVRGPVPGTGTTTPWQPPQPSGAAATDSSAPLQGGPLPPATPNAGSFGTNDQLQAQPTTVNPAMSPGYPSSQPTPDTRPPSAYDTFVASLSKDLLAPGNLVPAQLVTSISVVSGVDMPVLVKTMSQPCGVPVTCPDLLFFGTAEVFGANLLKITFTSVIVEGTEYPFTGIATESGSNNPAIRAAIVDKAPAAVQDLVRSTLGGFSDYVTALTDAADVAVSPNGTVLAQSKAPGLTSFLAAAAAETFRLPQNRTSVVRVLQLPAGQPLQVLSGKTF